MSKIKHPQSLIKFEEDNIANLWLRIIRMISAE